MRKQAAIVFLSASVAAQTTYTLSGCHQHGNVEYCFLPDGTETPWTTYSSSPSATAISTFSSVVTTTALTATATATGATVVTGCHSHGSSGQFCIVGNEEYHVVSGGSESYTSYTGCHAHSATEIHCSGDGMDVVLTAASTETTASATITSAISVASGITEVTGCHSHGSEGQYCIAGGAEYHVESGGNDSTTEYTGCEMVSDAKLHCTGNGMNVVLTAAAVDTTASDTTSSSLPDASSLPAGVSCHSHAGVPHCVDEQGNTVELGCARPENGYNVPLRIGLVFVILVTSALGVFLPILTAKFTKVESDSVVLIGIRQFGTGVIISTALVHLFTHADLYFSNECIKGIKYEATTAAIFMAGFFVTFVIEYVSRRLLMPDARATGTASTASTSEIDGSRGEKSNASRDRLDDTEAARNDALTVNIMEAGIIFHSIIIGLTLAVAGKSGFITLFVIILFHQMFEGLALGSRIATLRGTAIRKVILGVLFSLTTPVGMAIGLGVLSSFNGNDPSTLIAIGTITAFSGGMLLWVGVVEMWYEDWWHGPLARSNTLNTVVGFACLIAGLAIMSLLGKWA